MSWIGATAGDWATAPAQELRRRVPLERYATILAHMLHGEGHRSAALASFGLSNDEWRAVDAAWCGALAEATARGDGAPALELVRQLLDGRSRLLQERGGAREQPEPPSAPRDGAPAFGRLLPPWTPPPAGMSAPATSPATSPAASRATSPFASALAAPTPPPSSGTLMASGSLADSTASRVTPFQAPSLKPRLTLDEHAFLSAEIALNVETIERLLARRHISFDEKRASDEHYRQLVRSEPRVQVEWQAAFERARRELLATPRRGG